MTDPEGRELCDCGRARAMPADLERWLELGGDDADGGGPPPAPLPLSEMWARALCWTKPGWRCSMRRRWASDVWIPDVRSEFRVYMQITKGGTEPERWWPFQAAVKACMS